VTNKSNNWHEVQARQSGYPDATTQKLDELLKSQQAVQSSSSDSISVGDGIGSLFFVFVAFLAAISIYLSIEHDISGHLIIAVWGISAIVLACVLLFMSGIEVILFFIGFLSVLAVPVLIFNLIGGFWGFVFGLFGLAFAGIIAMIVCTYCIR